MNVRYHLGQAVEFRTYPNPVQEGVIERLPVGESPYYKIRAYGEVVLADEQDILGPMDLPDLDDIDAVETFLGG